MAKHSGKGWHGDTPGHHRAAQKGQAERANNMPMQKEAVKATYDPLGYGYTCPKCGSFGYTDKGDSHNEAFFECKMGCGTFPIRSSKEQQEVTGKFEKPIPVNWNYLTDETLRPGGIKIYKNGFSIYINLGAFGELQETWVCVRYFGEAKNGRMWVNSFSYSITHFPKEIQSKISKESYRVAKHGLEVVGVAF